MNPAPSSRGLTMRLLVASVLFVPILAAAQAVGTITTIAGGGVSAPNRALGNAVPAFDVASDGAGGFFALSHPENVPVKVRRVLADGTFVEYAGAASPGFSGDGGPAMAAQFRMPRGICSDAAGTLYIADTENHRLRKVDASGTITTFAGTGSLFHHGDGGLATAAGLGSPKGCAVDTDGSVLIADGTRVRRVSTAGIISTVAGTGECCSFPPASGVPALQAQVSPFRIAIDRNGAFLISEGSFIRRVDAAGTIHHVAGSTIGPASGGDGGPAAQASLPMVSGIAVDAAGNIFLVDSFIGRVRRIDAATGIIDTFAGGGTLETGFAPGMDAKSLFLAESHGLVFIGGELVVTAQRQGYREPGFAFAIDSAGRVQEQLTGQRFSAVDGEGGLATEAVIQETRAIDDGNHGVLFINGPVVRRVDAAGFLTTVAGTGIQGFSGDGGPAAAAAFSALADLDRDNAGNIFLADWMKHRVRRIDASGIVHPFAGSGLPTHGGYGGPALQASVQAPVRVATLPSGDVMIGVDWGYSVAKVSTDGVIHAGRNDGLRLVSSDMAGNTYYGDGSGKLFRESPDGTTTHIAGGGTSAAMGVPATSSQYGVTDVTVDPDGVMYLASNAAVYRVGIDGLITRIAGDGQNRVHGGDGGPAVDATVIADSVSWHSDGYLLVSGGQRIRKLIVADVVAAPFAFASVSAVATSTPQVAGPISITGINAAVPISVTGGEYSIGCTGTFTSAVGNVSNGQTVCIRHTSSDTGNDIRTTALVVGERRAEFTSHTAPGPGSASASVATLDLGAQSMFTTSPAQQFTVTNTSGSPITLNRFESAADFSASAACGTIAPGASCNVTVTMTPRTDGAVGSPLTLQMSFGPLAISLTGIGERSLATHYYRAILGRDPDTAGKAFWNGEAARAAALGANPKEAWYAMAATFFASPEYRGSNPTDAEFLADLYNTFFNRAGDGDGLAYWQGQLDAGIPREMLVTSFTFSTEFTTFTRAIFGVALVRPEVDLVMDLYRGYLSRLPDDAGFNHWVGRMRGVQCAASTKTDLMRAEVEAMTKGFIESAEYAARARSDAQFLADTYAALLRRGGDVAGFNYWLTQIAANGGRNAVRAAMIAYSPEFTARIAAATNASCLN